MTVRGDDAGMDRARALPEGVGGHRDFDTWRLRAPAPDRQAGGRQEGRSSADALCRHSVKK